MSLFWLAFALTLASGWLVARALTAGAWTGPRWASVITEISLGAFFGPGLASVLYFALLAAGAANRGSVLGALAGFLAASAGIWWRLAPSNASSVKAQSRFPWIWALWIAAAIGLIFFVLDFQSASSSNPAGEWDAISIWNLRARYLASGGDLWRRAVSSEIGGHMVGAAHPGYPLFLSGFIALLWQAGSTFDQAVPIAVALLIALATIAMLGGSLAAARSTSLALLGCLVLFASEVFASQTAAQYSDL